MKPIAIVYSSYAGHTARYAALLGEKTGLPVCAMQEAEKRLKRGAPVIYMGWLLASTIKDYGKARRRYDVRAVCGVGLCDTGALMKEVRKAARVPENVPLFTLQGGMDRSKLQGIYGKMIDTLTKFMASKKNRSADEERMLELLRSDTDFVSEANLKGVLEWYKSI